MLIKYHHPRRLPPGMRERPDAKLNVMTLQRHFGKERLPTLQVLLMTSNLTSKGQVTVPKSVRDYLGLRPGSAVIFERRSSGEVVLRPASRTKTRPSPANR